MKRDRVEVRPSRRYDGLGWTVKRVSADGSGWSKSYHRSEFEARANAAILRDEIKNG